MQALYGLARLKIGRYQNEPDPEQKKKYLAEAREILTEFVKLYPDSIFTAQASKNLEDLPAAQ